MRVTRPRINPLCFKVHGKVKIPAPIEVPTSVIAEALTDPCSAMNILENKFFFGVF